MPQTQDLQSRPAVEKLCTSLLGTSFKKKLAQSLPASINIDNYVRSAANAVQMHAQKEKFNNCDTTTFFLAVQNAATDGLLLDGRESTLVAYWNKKKEKNDISYIPMVGGLVKAARNSGVVIDVQAFVVYQSDTFSFRPGIDKQPSFEPDWKCAPSLRGNPVLAFAVVYLKGGGVIAPEPMHAERILNIGKGGNNFNQYNPGTGSDWQEWWKKAAIRNALKFAPKASENINSNTTHSLSREQTKNILEADDKNFGGETLEGDYVVDTSTGEVLDHGVKTAPQTAGEAEAPPEQIEEGPAGSPVSSNPAYDSLYKKVMATQGADECKALKDSPMLKKLNSADRNEILDIIESHATALMVK